MTASEMSVRDQRVGTSYSDRVREDVSLEYVTLSKRFDEGVSRDKLRAGDKFSRKRVRWTRR